MTYTLSVHACSPALHSHSQPQWNGFPLPLFSDGLTVPGVPYHTVIILRNVLAIDDMMNSDELFIVNANICVFIFT